MQSPVKRIPGADISLVCSPATKNPLFLACKRKAGERRVERGLAAHHLRPSHAFTQ